MNKSFPPIGLHEVQKCGTTKSDFPLFICLLWIYRGSSTCLGSGTGHTECGSRGVQATMVADLLTGAIITSLIWYEANVATHNGSQPMVGNATCDRDVQKMAALATSASHIVMMGCLVQNLARQCAPFQLHTQHTAACGDLAVQFLPPFSKISAIL